MCTCILKEIYSEENEFEINSNRIQVIPTEFKGVQDNSIELK